ncbi:hypothetical protein [Nonomuraea sp. NPDC049309]|uniref:hypothetical protein n=1 Tax=Nonomuraea sp. NPDC049309 TaxID=3364350 RepID=UPI00371AEAE6
MTGCAGRLAAFQRMAAGATSRPALVNGLAGRPVSVMSFTIPDGRIAEIGILSDPARPAARGLEP